MSFPKGYDGSDPYRRKRDFGDYEEPKGFITGKRIAILLGIIVLIAVITVLVIAGFRTVDSGTVGLKTTFGQVQENVLNPGMHVINPFTDNVIKMSVRVEKEAQTAGAASKDLQDVQIAVVVNYRINGGDAVWIFKTLGTDFAAKIIDPRVSEAVKAVSARFNAGELITNRETVRNQIQDLLTSSLKLHNINVEGVQITNFAFSEAFSNTIEQSQVAKQQLVTQQNVLAKVKIDAQQKIAIADANKNATIAEAEGQAEAIALIQQALASSPNYVEYQKVQKWDGILPKVTGSEGGNILTLPQDLLTNATKP